MKGLAVLVLRYKQPGNREFACPSKLQDGQYRNSRRSGTDYAQLCCLLCLINLFTKQVATISGVAFTLVFFAIFEISEKITRKHGATHQELDMFNLESDEELTPAGLGVRPGNALVMVRNSKCALQPGRGARSRQSPARRMLWFCICVFLAAQVREQRTWRRKTFSASMNRSYLPAPCRWRRRRGQVHPPGSRARNGKVGRYPACRTGNLQSSTIALGMSSWRGIADEARMAGLAWEALPEPRPQLTLEIYSPTARKKCFIWVPTPRDLPPRRSTCCTASGSNSATKSRPKNLHHHDVVHIALEELKKNIVNGRREEIIGALRQHLKEIRARPR